MDFETLLGLAGAVLFPLAVVVLVLWPILVAVIESSKVIRGSVRPSTSFVITDTGATIWQKDSRNSTTDSIRVGDKRLRLSVLLACGMEAAFIVFLTVFLFQHAAMPPLEVREDSVKVSGLPRAPSPVHPSPKHQSCNPANMPL